jgi:phosphomannomutase/phosphoglucomutase
MKGKTNNNAQGRPLVMYLLPGLLVATVTVLILAVLTYQILSRGADKRADKTMSHAATLLSVALSAEVRNRIDRLRFLAAEPGLAAWVERGMSAADQQAETARLSTWLPGVLDVRLLPAGWQTTDPTDKGLPAPLGYAGVEMIHRVVKTGKPAPAEVHQADIGKPYIAMAVPLWRHKQVVGVLMAAYPPNSLNKLLRDLEPLPGVLRLEQVVGKQQHYVLSETQAPGSVSLEHAPNVAVGGTIWQVSYAATPQFPFGLGLTSFLGFVLLGLLPLALIFWLQLRLLARGMQNDMDGIAEQVRALVAGQSRPPIQPHLGLTASLQQQLLKLQHDARQHAGRHAAGANAKPTAAAPSLAIPAQVFRAYDIRGKADEELTMAFAQRLGAVLGDKLRMMGTGHKVVVGHDVRHSSDRLQAALITGLTSGGCDVVDLGMVPTPVVYFGQTSMAADAAVVVTGSHNPAQDNGFKIVIGRDVLAGDELAALGEAMRTVPAPAAEHGQCVHREIDHDYQDKVVGDVALMRQLRVVVDAGNGAAGPLAVRLLEALGCEVVPLFCEPDGDFPNHHPDPSQPENLASLALEVQAREADIGLAFDGDGDRLGVVDSDGNTIWPDRVLMLLARDLLIRQPGADVLYDVKCSRHLGRYILTHGGRPLMNPSGHSRMRARMTETGAMLGGEFSGHLFIRERWFGFDDALYAAIRVLEIIATDERPSAEQFAELPHSPATPEYHLQLKEGENTALMEQLAANTDFTDAELVSMDGLRVEFADGWGLVRPSNTTPSLAFRFEADNDAALTRIQDRIRAWVKRVDPQLSLPF